MGVATGFETRLAGAREGRPEAWVALYDELAPIIYSYLRAQSLDDPDDVAGETFLQVVRDLGRFDGTERQFRSWALAIAHHRMLDARRARSRRPQQSMPSEELPEVVGSDVTSDQVLDHEEWHAVRAHLDQLTEDQRAVVVLRVVNELSLEETAAVLERTVGSVKALQHRAFGALRAQLTHVRNPPVLHGAHPAWPT